MSTSASDAPSPPTRPSPGSSPVPSSGPSSDSSPGATASSGARLGVAALLSLAVLVAYLPALSAGFVYDDLRLVQVNPNVRGLGAAAGAFFEPLWAFEDPTGEFQNAFWRPLTVFTIAVGRTISGLEPAGYHWISVLLHAAATLAAWRFATKLLSSEVLGGAVGLLFALHPVHVESVAWISAVNDPLYGLFALLALGAHLAWRKRGSRGIAVGGAVWFLLALLSKEQALVVPLVVLVLDAALGELNAKANREDDPFARLGRAYGGMLVALALYYAGRVIAYDGSLLAGFNQVAAGFGLSGPNVSMRDAALRLEAGRDLTFRLEAFGTFLTLLFAPLDQAVFRMVRAELPEGYTALRIAAFASVAWVAAVGWAWVRRARIGLALLLAIPASFVLLIIKYESAGGFPISDRYLYVSVALAGALLAWFLARRFSRENAATLVGLLALAFGVKTFLYARHFQDEERFFRHAVAASPDLPYVRWGLGRVLLDKYQRLEERDILDEAAFHFHMGQKLGTDYGKYEERMADRLAPDRSYRERTIALGELINGTPSSGRKPDPTVTVTMLDRMQSNMGVGWCTLFLAKSSKTPDFDWPLTVFEQCVEFDPTDPRARLGMGTVLMETGRLEEAEKALSEAVNLDRSLAEAWHNLALCLERQKRYDDARQAYTQALRIRPGALGDLMGLVQTSIDGRRYDLAERHLDDAEKLYAGNAELLYLRGVLLAARGDLANALIRFDQVLATQPDHPKAHLQRGGIFAARGNVEEAMRSLTRACELMPESFLAHQSVAEILLSMGRGDAALSYLRRSYQLSPANEMRHAVHGQLMMLLGDDADAMAALAEMDAARRDPLHALSFAERALDLRKADFTASQDGFSRLNYLRGQLLWQLERIPEAVTAFEDCLRTAKEDFFALHDLAILHSHHLEDPETARSYAQRALTALDSVRNVPPDLVKAMRERLTTIAEREPLMGPLPDLGDG